MCLGRACYLIGHCKKSLTFILGKMGSHWRVFYRNDMPSVHSSILNIITCLFLKRFGKVINVLKYKKDIESLT